MILDFYDFTIEYTYHGVSADQSFIENFITGVRQKEHWNVDVYRFAYTASAEIYHGYHSFIDTIASLLAADGIAPSGLTGFYTNQIDQIKCKYQNMDIKLNIMQDCSILQVIYPTDQKIRCYICGAWDLWCFRSIYLSVLIYTDVRQLLLHGAALSIHDKGFLLLGTSGAGKTTASNIALSEGHQVLTDESPILLDQNGEILLAGSPWSGSEQCLAGRHQTVRLRAILRLEKSPDDSLSVIDNKIFKMNILAKQIYSVEKSEKLFTEKNLYIIKDICNTIPYYTLYFTKSPNFIPILDQHAV